MRLPRIAAAAVILCAISAALLYQKPLVPWNPAFAANPAWDLHRYIAMAQGQSDHVAPHCWRYGVPLLARGLSLPGLPLWWAFLALACGAMFSLAWVIHSRTGLFGLLMLFALPQIWMAPLWDFWLPDAAMLLAVALGVIWNRSRWFVLLVVAACVVKELGLLLVPLWYGLRVRKIRDRQRLLEFGFLAVAGLVAWGTCAFWSRPASLLPMAAGVIAHPLQWRPAFDPRFALIEPLGVLLPLAAFHPQRRRLLRLVPFALGIGAVWLLSYSTPERFAVLLVPPAILLLFGRGTEKESIRC